MLFHCPSIHCKQPHATSPQFISLELFGTQNRSKKTNQFHQCHGWIFQLRLVNSPHWYFQKIPPRAAKQTGMYSLAASSILPKARRKCSISLKNLPEASLVSQFLLTEWSGVYFQDLGVQKNGGVHNFPTYSPKSLCFFLFKQTLNAWVIPW